VDVPQPAQSDIIDRDAAVRLGKALYWDVQVGSDGATACASCHATAGADGRLANVLHPGPNGLFEAGGVVAPGQVWNGASINTFDDRVASPGVHAATFAALDPDPNQAAELCTLVPVPPFMTERQVTQRHTPTVFGAVFFRQLFWDGRASHRFNGKNPFGASGNSLEPAFVDHDGASLASQAVGPPTSHIEMACAGRPFNGAGGLGAKLLARTPLGQQLVDPTDAVLGALSRAPLKGLTRGYPQMIEEAFGATLAAQAADQFSRLFGQAIQAYEATLIPSQTPFDRFLDGDDNAMTPAERAGWDLFRGRLGCTNCHQGTELSDATVSFRKLVNRTTNLDGGDLGFHNVGVRPTAEDLGRADTGPGGQPFSESGGMADRGAFKTPQLRNVGLTAPYMHNGGLSTLEEVVDFYAMGGAFANPEKSSRVQPFTVTVQERDEVVIFLRHALTDCRVEKRRAPFDHPELALPDGTVVAAVGADGVGPCP
jgi:cytochrome c peroxidase